MPHSNLQKHQDTLGVYATSLKTVGQKSNINPQKNQSKPNFTYSKIKTCPHK
jgi:hypothetical protein